MSVGAYTAAVILREFPGAHWILAMLGGGCAAALAGMFFGIPSLRIKGLYLAVSTLAAQLIIEWIINHWSWLSGGAQGSIYIQAPTFPWIEDGALVSRKMEANLHYYYLIYVVLAIGILFALNLFRSHLGRAFIAVRDRDIAAEIIGINIFRTKLVAFGIASFYAGVAGVLYTYFYSIANFESFTLLISIQFLAMCIIGGPRQHPRVDLRGDLHHDAADRPRLHASRGRRGGVRLGRRGRLGHHAAVEPHHVRRPHHVLPGRRAGRPGEDVRNFTDYFRVWPFPYV